MGFDYYAGPRLPSLKGPLPSMTSVGANRDLHDCQATSSKLREVLRSDTIGVLASWRIGAPRLGYHLEGEATNPTGFGDLFNALVKDTTYPIFWDDPPSRLGFLGNAIGRGVFHSNVYFFWGAVRCVCVCVCVLFCFWLRRFGGEMMIPNLEEIKQKKHQLVYGCFQE